MANVEIMATFCFYFVLHGHFFFSFFLIIFFVLPLYFLHVPACCYFVEPHWSFFWSSTFFHYLNKAWLAATINNSVILGLK